MTYIKTHHKKSKTSSNEETAVVNGIQVTEVCPFEQAVRACYQERDGQSQRSEWNDVSPSTVFVKFMNMLVFTDSTA